MRRNAHYTYSYKYASTEGKRTRLLFFVIIKETIFLLHMKHDYHAPIIINYLLSCVDISKNSVVR